MPDLTAPEVWRSWTANDPEPHGVSIVRDASGVVSYTDSPEWQRGIGVWRGYKAGERVSLDWVELQLLYGPVTGKQPAPKEAAA